MASIKAKSDVLMDSLQKYYNENQDKFHMMLPIIEGRSNISLRVIDWFVTNYSKKFNISYKIIQTVNTVKAKKVVTEKMEILFKVYSSYKSQLKAYSKKQCDPFCRVAGGEKYSFYYNNNDYIDTTAGQLNFFRWALENDVITYIRDNITSIEKDMLVSTKNVQTVEQPKKVIEPRRRRISKKLKEVVKPKQTGGGGGGCGGGGGGSDNIQINIDVKKRRKRHELSKSASKGLNKHDCEVVITF